MTDFFRGPVSVQVSFACYLFLLICSLSLLAQEKPEDIGSARNQLSEVRNEIKALQTQLSSSQKTLKSQLQEIENLDQQATLQQKALRLLQRELHGRESEVTQLSDQIGSLETQVDKLKSVFARQALFSYKYQRGREFDWILGSENFNQALIRYRYFRSISASVNRLYQRLTGKQRELAGLQENRNSELREKNRLLNERTSDTRKLEQQLAERQRLSKNIQRNKELLETALNEKKRSFSQLTTLIGSLESTRGQRRQQTSDPAQWEKIKGDFAGQKKRLNWPVKGSVVQGFGKLRNPKLKTVLQNNGIDIQAKKGTPVFTVFNGVVSLITYMSGFGNTVIVDHNNGFYTVYAHLNEVLVNKFQLVEAGDTIATVGDSGSLEGARLHFEIYGSNKPLNPTLWLK